MTGALLFFWSAVLRADAGDELIEGFSFDRGRVPPGEDEDRRELLDAAGRVRPEDDTHVPGVAVDRQLAVPDGGLRLADDRLRHLLRGRGVAVALRVPRGEGGEGGFHGRLDVGGHLPQQRRAREVVAVRQTTDDGHLVVGQGRPVVALRRPGGDLEPEVPGRDVHRRLCRRDRGVTGAGGLAGREADADADHEADEELLQVTHDCLPGWWDGIGPIHD